VQTVLKLTVPGVPDVYQGAELWDLSLVDPDNRRPVDYAQRTTLLTQVLEQWSRDPQGTLRELAEHWQDGRIKLLLTTLLLRLRQHDDALFRGGYEPWEVSSLNAGAFVRRSDTGMLLVVFRRFPLATAREAGDPPVVRLPDCRGQWEDVFTRRLLPVQPQWTMDPMLPVSVLRASAPHGAG
jgi:(1->4)-alpha-D-glucan 1-alpha-D-glucosylmutase